MDDSYSNEFTWSVRPASLHPKKAVFAWVLIFVVGALMASVSLLLGICSVILLIATQATFLFPTRFSIDEVGLHAKYPIQKKRFKWTSVRRVMFGREGCCLFARKKASILDGFSGLPVFYGVCKEEVESAIKTYLPPEVAQVSSTSKDSG